MSCSLSSLLVRDGLVSMQRLELALSRQQTLGGGMDTALLELDLVPEQRLLQYLSLASGLPPAYDHDQPTAEAAQRVPEELAARFHVAPLAVTEGHLRLLVHDPVDMSAVRRLARELSTGVQPLVTTEYRFRLVFSQVYGGVAAPRFHDLAKRAPVSDTNPVGRPPSVIVQRPRRRTSVLNVPVGDARPQTIQEAVSGIARGTGTHGLVPEDEDQ